ncbi:MAG: peptide ABC transporter substrate-binding protein [Candidatus Limiplasma sp.]|nr:peptide ABC transporter substrate-binding protein [Candidatus Limiplasma sp.]
MKNMASKLVSLVLCLTLVLNIGSFASAEGEKVLKVQIETEVQSLDPQVATDGTSFEVIADFTDGLYQMDANGASVPALAADTAVSADGLTYTFKIRDDAFWSNGDPVTADDFVYGWQRAVDPKFASEYAFILTDIGQIKNAAAIFAGEKPMEELGVKAVDDKTLQVELAVPVSFFTSLLYFPTYYPVNRAFCEQCGDTYATSPETVLSNGAFILSTYEPAATSFTLTKNAKYYDADRVKLDGLSYQVIKDSQTALLSYSNGDLDIVTLSGDQVELVADDPEFSTMNAGYLWYVAVNGSAYEELGNVNFRKALSCAFDREAIAANIVKDGSTAASFAVPEQLATGPDGQDFRATAPAYDGSDKAKAAEYYAAACKELGKSEFKLNMVVEDDATAQNVAAFIQQEWQNTLPGVTVELTVETKKQRVKDLQDGNFNVGLTRWGPDYADPMTYLNMWITGNSNNYGNWSNAEYDEIINSCISGPLALDPAARWTAMHDAEKIVMDNAVILPIYQKCNAMMIQSTVKGIEFHAIALNRVYKDTTIE